MGKCIKRTLYNSNNNSTKYMTREDAVSSVFKILNKKQATQKTTAYCIVKTFNPKKEVEDYFNIKKTRHHNEKNI